jgi:aminopeptidase N
MEYPGLVLISERYLSNSIDSLRTVIVHETAHQWFYGIIGDDEIDEGWIDEGLTSFFTAYFEIGFTGEYYYEGTMERYQNRVDNFGFDNIVIAKSAYEFDNWDDYGVAAYSKPALMYHEIKNLYGDEKIEEFARELYHQYAYKILKEADLRKVLVQVYGEEITELLDRWLY